MIIKNIKKIYQSFGLLTFLLAGAGSVNAQNIVTIFGQEKVDKTDEGDVFYNFKDGYLLPGGTNPGTLYNGQDMIGWMYATDNFEAPKDGKKLEFDYPNMKQQYEDAYLSWLAKSKGEKDMERLPLWTWTAISADSLGVFKRPEMRSAFLYTAYDAPADEIALLETTGGTRTYVNGMPHEGDHYDFGYSLIPIKLKKGINEFVYTPGRFGKVSSKLVKPEKPVQFTLRDLTTPDIIIGEKDAKWAAVRVVNATDQPVKGLSIRATLPTGEQEVYKTEDLMALNTRKLKYKIPAATNPSEGTVPVKLELLDRNDKVLDTKTINTREVPASKHHERTFVSKIDGSVQYYSVAPALRKDKDDQKALVLTVHGAGVEARNQARAYKSKDWTDIVAATNRRPYGFNWEEWGRMDALEVLEEAKRVFNPDETKIYLTGHSMGGHGSWFLGTTYPDKFAAIAPCAGYPDIATYSRGQGDSMHEANKIYEPIARAANGGRVKSIVNNLKQSGVYIFHGDADNVVPTDQARQMREELGKFHPDFAYCEYPGGEHWFGDESVDWKPIFEFFERHDIPDAAIVQTIDFNTASPSISSKDYWIEIQQQERHFDFSRIKAHLNADSILVDSISNIVLLVLDVPALKKDEQSLVVNIDGQNLKVPTNKKAYLQQNNGNWTLINGINPKQKNATRYGGFKNAFDNQVVLVYPTKGSKESNEWYKNRARFDAETFYYRGNGSVDVIPDVDYIYKNYPDRNVVIYGNSQNNAAWSKLLKNSPIQVNNKNITIKGDENKKYDGDDLATYFVYPNPYSNIALVGVVAGTGVKGMKATSPNNYISGITGFPDVMIFRADALKNGLESVEDAGFFDNNWEIKNGLK